MDAILTALSKRSGLLSCLLYLKGINARPALYSFDISMNGGLSLVLFDLTTPGITTRPIRLISGNSPFTETLFENVRVEKNQVVGELNMGWTVAKYLLTHEREMIGASGLGQPGAEPLGEIAARVIGLGDGRLANPLLRGDIARLDIDAIALSLSMERARDEVAAGASLGAGSSMFKYYGTELNMRREELLMAIHGQHALEWSGPGTEDGRIPRHWLRSRGNEEQQAALLPAIASGKTLVMHALNELDHDVDDAAACASMTKAKSAETAMRVTAEAIQMHGGIGMTDDFDIGFFFKRARILETLLGDHYYHLDRFARQNGY